ncbi:hypothetical protein QYE76_025613 [Lolium multiflorum]|uniref:Uncharacterized protein n=1 Tax=Lolium multiflorum TaxID=4521 RepID=A0AAD8RG44_LOLMU|nr:hypothetical protein QYE76_025613 [Lolium multiflorum]
MENYSLLMGAAVMKMAVEMAAVSMEKPSGGTSPLRQAPEQRLLSPRSWLRDDGGSGRFRGFPFVALSDVSFTMYRGLKMKPRMLYPSWAHLGKKFHRNSLGTSKSSINQAKPESESIFVPESHVVPMEIDEGNPGVAPANSGTAVNLGTTTPMPEEAMLVDSMDIDMPVFVVREAPSWVKPIKEFLVNGTLPVDEKSRRIQRRSKAYTIINDEAYKRSVTVSSKDVWSRKKEEKCLRKFIEENAAPRLVKGAGGKSVPAWVLLAHGFE